jgi:hypothetical protein
MVAKERWVNGAIHDPGKNAGNSLTMMQFTVIHFTAGVDSRNIGKNGYFNMLFPKKGEPYQYAGLDELTWHAGPWNPFGAGLEFERLTADEPLTEDQEFWGGVVASILNRDWGIPLEHYQGPRFQAKNFRGFVNHGDLDDQRSDGVTEEEWGKFLSHNAPKAEEEGEVFMIWQTDEADGSHKHYVIGTGGMLEIDPGVAYVTAMAGGKVVPHVPPLAILRMGLDNAKMMQRAMALDFNK